MNIFNESVGSIIGVLMIFISSIVLKGRERKKPDKIDFNERSLLLL